MELDDDVDADEVLDVLEQLKEAWPNRTWTWDERFIMIASAFTKEQAALARETALLALPYAWNSTTVATAPAGLQTICNRTGGLRAGQMLMAGKAGGIVLVGLWWPWGGGAQITMRIGLGEHHAMEAPFPAVRDLFGARRD